MRGLAELISPEYKALREAKTPAQQAKNPSGEPASATPYGEEIVAPLSPEMAALRTMLSTFQPGASGAQNVALGGVLAGTPTAVPGVATPGATTFATPAIGASAGQLRTSDEGAPAPEGASAGSFNVTQPFGTSTASYFAPEISAAIQRQIEQSLIAPLQADFAQRTAPAIRDAYSGAGALMSSRRGDAERVALEDLQRQLAAQSAGLVGQQQQSQLGAALQGQLQAEGARQGAQGSAENAQFSSQLANQGTALQGQLALQNTVLGRGTATQAAQQQSQLANQQGALQGQLAAQGGNISSGLAAQQAGTAAALQTQQLGAGAAESAAQRQLAGISLASDVANLPLQQSQALYGLLSGFQGFDQAQASAAFSEFQRMAPENNPFFGIISSLLGTPMITTYQEPSFLQQYGSLIGAGLGLAAAPLTGGTSLLGTALGGLGGLFGQQ